MKYAPHDYQKQAIKFVVGNARGGVLLDPGLGKTGIMYAAMKILRQTGHVKRALVIAPLRPAHSVWPAEAEKWDEFQDLRVNVLHGEHKESLLLQDHDVSVINPEGLDWLFERLQEKDLRKRDWPWEMLIVDESTMFKNPGSKRFKLIRKYLPRFKRRYALTGTPSPNGLMDLFGQMYIVDLGEALGSYITHYRMSYFDQTGFGGYTWKLREGAEQKIYEKLKPITLRMSAEDYLKLPPMVENTVYVDLPMDAMKAYLEMEHELITQLGDATVFAPNSAAAAGKCRQIANGGIYTNTEVPGGPRKFRNIHDAKTQAVIEILEELGGKPAFIAYEFAHDLTRLRQALKSYAGGEVPYLGGGVTAKRQREIEAAWNRGELPVLLAQPQSVAHGLNLQEVGAAVIWHSLPWDLGLYQQFNKRIHRQGQKERVVVTRIVARDTIDHAVLGALKAKDKSQSALLGALRAYTMERKVPGTKGLKIPSAKPR